MNDKELLQLAAKAAGIQTPWNPLTDDGDAFRLAVHLKIHYRQYSTPTLIRGVWCPDGYVEACHGKYVQERELVNDDIYAATRRAIVRAAAEMGRNIP